MTVVSIRNILKSKVFWRSIVIYSFIWLFAFFGLGFAFFFIFIGLFMALIRFSKVYSPASRLLATMIGFLTGLPKGKYTFDTLSGPFWHKILIALPSLIWLGMAGLGVFILLRNGFLAQNLIYLLFFK